MKGIIRTYLPEKRYGFIKGDDGKDYFFHESEFRDQSQVAHVCEQAFVDFDQAATPKGYKARNCFLIDSSRIATYAVPDEFITSRSSDVRGWDIIERGNWIVHGTSRNSPESARKDVTTNATRVGANALLELEYYKTTGSEAGTGRGTHYFTIHNFRGRVATLGKKTAAARHTAEQLAGLNRRAELLKANLANQTRASRRKRDLVWLVVIVVSLALLAMGTAPAAVLLMLAAGVIFGRSTDYDGWLQRA